MELYVKVSAQYTIDYTVVLVLPTSTVGEHVRSTHHGSGVTVMQMELEYPLPDQVVSLAAVWSLQL